MSRFEREKSPFGHPARSPETNRRRPGAVDGWNRWPEDGRPWTVGIEEEVMLLDPESWALAQCVEEVLDALPSDVRTAVCSETHSGAIELNTRPHATVAGAAADLGRLRSSLTGVLDRLGLRAGCSGTHPFADWHEMRVADADRHQAVAGSMRELARREPTFALHVHVAVPTSAAAMAAANQMRAHLPLLLALSANSPYWQGRDSGLASARTPLFQAFPRVGIPRAFASYNDWVETVDLLVRCQAFPDHSFLWWDVRLQPRYGTVEVRIMDAQCSVERAAALTALVQCLVRLEATEGYAPAHLLQAQEVLDENRFLAARDGVEAALIDPVRERRVPLHELVGPLLDACAPHAADLGCEAELGLVRLLADEGGAQRQRRLAGDDEDLCGLVARLSEAYAPLPVAAA
ncbi:MAG: YbdK family carboxylate-amine ligase [Actinomycetota bacterium]|nr:YbdK family carboxylate-amine ligase [Actinomycetota bacterium]MDQ5808109.1 YbdK family carboxylate-amine ligase [Actinomycetota bacterium]